MTDIEVVRTLTGNTEISDDFIALFLDSTTKFVLAYCNIDTIPEGLKPTLLEMTAFRVKANSNGAVADLGAGVEQVGSVSDGNQSISYAAGSSGSKQFVSEEDLVAAFGYVLDRFRRMVVDHSSPQRNLGSRCLHTRHPHPNDTRW